MQCVSFSQLPGRTEARCERRAVDGANFCEPHVELTRDAYSRYKKACDKFDSGEELALPEDKTLREQVMNASFRHLLATRCTEGRLAFRAEWVHPSCWDAGHAMAIQYYSDAADFYEVINRQLNARIIQQAEQQTSRVAKARAVAAAAEATEMRRKKELLVQALVHMRKTRQEQKAATAVAERKQRDSEEEVMRDLERLRVSDKAERDNNFTQLTDQQHQKALQQRKAQLAVRMKQLMHKIQTDWTSTWEPISESATLWYTILCGLLFQPVWSRLLQAQCADQLRQSLIQLDDWITYYEGNTKQQLRVMRESVAMNMLALTDTEFQLVEQQLQKSLTLRYGWSGQTPRLVCDQRTAKSRFPLWFKAKCWTQAVLNDLSGSDPERMCLVLAPPPSPEPTLKKMRTDLRDLVSPATLR